jgi:hypothetical protein
MSDRQEFKKYAYAGCGKAFGYPYCERGADLLVFEPRKEFIIMVMLAIGNIPLMYFLNKSCMKR